MNQFVQNLIDGLGAGSTYALLAVGVSMLFGVMHLVNFAHGELLTDRCLRDLRDAGATTCRGGVVIPVSILAAVLLSMTIEFVAFRRVRGCERVHAAVDVVRDRDPLPRRVADRGVVDPPRRYEPPDIAFKVVEIGNFNVELWDVISIVVAIICFAGTALMLRGHDVRPRDPCSIGGLRRRVADGGAGPTVLITGGFSGGPSLFARRHRRRAAWWRGAARPTRGWVPNRCSRR